MQVKIIDNDGAIMLGPTALNIAEDGVSGVYIWNAPTSPAAVGQYSIIWSGDGTFTPEGGMGVDELIIVAAGQIGTVPPISPPAAGGLGVGPCSAWTTSEDAAACCADVGTFVTLLDDSISAASQVLWELSGRRFAGLCSDTVRPCRVGCGCGGWQVLSRGHLVMPEGHWGYCEGSPCGCHDLSRVLLSGYPVREIIEVKIDGVVIAASEYRLDEERYLTRLNGDSWPSCARLDLPDTEDGTFSVVYTYGQSPPLLGSQAAGELACQIYLACLGDSDCKLPTGATRVVRQGITVERQTFSYDVANRAWRTGLQLVDLFLNTYNPTNLRRRPAFWGPGRRYARPVG